MIGAISFLTPRLPSPQSPDAGFARHRASPAPVGRPDQARPEKHAEADGANRDTLGADLARLRMRTQGRTAELRRVSDDLTHLREASSAPGAGSSPAVHAAGGRTSERERADAVEGYAAIAGRQSIDESYRFARDQTQALLAAASQAADGTERGGDVFARIRALSGIDWAGRAAPPTGSYRIAYSHGDHARTLELSGGTEMILDLRSRPYDVLYGRDSMTLQFPGGGGFTLLGLSDGGSVGTPRESGGVSLFNFQPVTSIDTRV